MDKMSVILFHVVWNWEKLNFFKKMKLNQGLSPGLVHKLILVRSRRDLKKDETWVESRKTTRVETRVEISHTLNLPKEFLLKHLPIQVFALFPIEFTETCFGKNTEQHSIQ